MSARVHLLALSALTFAGCGPTTEHKSTQAKPSAHQAPAAESESDAAQATDGAPAQLPTRADAIGPELAAKQAAFNEKADATKKADYARGIEELEASGVLDAAKNVGDQAPEFELKDATGKSVKLAELLGAGPVVLVWYRGGWCPYCNITLKGYGRRASEFKDKGATLVAISPELPDNSLDTQQKHELDFLVLSDTGNEVADDYGIRFELPDYVAKHYNDAFDLEKYNGDTSNTLPLAATYVIDQSGKIRWAFLSADYKQRAEPADVLAALDEL